MNYLCMEYRDQRCDHEYNNHNYIVPYEFDIEHSAKPEKRRVTYNAIPFESKISNFSLPSSRWHRSATLSLRWVLDWVSEHGSQGCLNSGWMTVVDNRCVSVFHPGSRLGRRKDSSAVHGKELWVPLALQERYKRYARVHVGLTTSLLPFRGILAGRTGHRHSVRPVTDASQKNWELHHSGDWFRYRWPWRRRIRLPPAFRRPSQGAFDSMFSTTLLTTLFRFLTFFVRTAAPIGTLPTCMGKGKL